MTKKKFQASTILRRADVVPSTLDKKGRTVQVVFSTGSRVLNMPWASEPYYEELSLESGHVRLDRLNNGAPFLKAHNSFELENVLGVIDSASVDGKQGVAVVRFSERPDVEPIFNDVVAGVFRHVSVGYKVYKYEEQPRADNDYPVYRAVDWEPVEVSLVPIGADDKAIVRAAADGNPCELILLEDKKMKKRNETDTPAAVVNPDEQVAEVEKVEVTPEAPADLPTPDVAPVVEIPAEAPAKVEGLEVVEEARAEGAKNERARVEEITSLVEKARLDKSFADEMIKGGVAIDGARKLVLERLLKIDGETSTRSAKVEVMNMNDKQVRIESVNNALLHRYDPMKYKLTEAGRQYRGMSLVEIAREFVDASGKNTRGMDRSEVVRRAFMETSDFPNLLSGVVNKTLLDAYQSAPQTFDGFTRRTYVPDFKGVKRIQLGGAPTLEKVLENAEVKHGAIGENAETVQICTYSKIIAITRQAIINDDLDAFTRIPALYGQAAKDLESDLVWAIITGNPTMADGRALFEATYHKNYTSSGTVISVDSLSVGRTAMKKQKGLNNKPLNIIPKYLIVPATLETVAQRFCAQNLLGPVNSNEYNPLGGTIIPVAEPRLDDNDDKHWYLAADKAQLDIVELVSLEGQDAPIISTNVRFDIEGVEIKATRDVGAKVIDHRGLYMNAGA